MRAERSALSGDIFEGSAGLEDSDRDSSAQVTPSDTAAGDDRSAPDTDAAAGAERSSGASITSPPSHATASVEQERRSVTVAVSDTPDHAGDDSTPSAEEIAEDKNTLGIFKADLFQLLGSPSQNPTPTKAEDSGRIFEELVAKYTALMNILDQPCNLKYSETACAGMLALRLQRLNLASNIYDDLVFATSTTAALTYVMRGAWRFLRYFSIFITVAAMMIFILPMMSKTVSDSIPILDGIRYSLAGDFGKVIIAAFFGCLGGVVSLLLRLAEFEAMRGRSREFLALTGGTLPVVGGVFAAVVGAIFAADIVNVTAGDETGLNVWLFVVLGFLSGFSERFTRNILGAAEERLSGSVSSASHSEKISLRVNESRAASTAS